MESKLSEVLEKVIEQGKLSRKTESLHSSRFKGLFSSSLDLNILLDEKFNIKEANQEAFKVIPGLCVGESFLDLMEDTSAFIEALYKGGGQIFPTSIKFSKSYTAVASVIPLEESEPEILVQIKDLTEYFSGYTRKLETYNLFSKIIDAVNNIIVIYELSGDLVFVSDPEFISVATTSIRSVFGEEFFTQSAELDSVTQGEVSVTIEYNGVDYSGRLIRSSAYYILFLREVDSSDANALKLHRNRLYSNAFNEVAYHLMQCGDPDGLVDQAMSLIGKILKFDRVFIYQNESSLAGFKIAHSYVGGGLKMFKDEDRFFLSITDTVDIPEFREILRHKSLIVNRKSSKTSEPIKNLMDDVAIETLVCSPILLGKYVWGILVLASVKKEDLDTYDLEIVKNISKLISCLIKRKRLCNEKI